MTSTPDAVEIASRRRAAGETAAPSPDVKAETERLLAGRTRDIKMSGALLRLYQERSWPQRSNIVRAWAIWKILLSYVVLLIYTLVYPNDLWLSAPMVGVFIPLTNIGLYLIWRHRRRSWIEGLSVLLILIAVICSYGIVGLSAGGLDSERYLNGSLYVASTGIFLFRVERIWSAAMGCLCPLVYLAFLLLNPLVEVEKALGSCMFYWMGLFAVVAARHNAEIIFKKNFLMALRNDYRSAELTQANQQLEALARRDPLTGLANRRWAADHITKLWADDAVSKNAVAFVMADIDHFKKLNDTAGHAGGDECLKRVADCIEASVRIGTDVVCRYGGEEFLIVLTGVTQDAAWTMAERIRSEVEALAIVNPGLQRIDRAPGLVTVSVGVGMAAAGIAPDQVAERADKALYEAKHGGRNRVAMSLAADCDLAAATLIPSCASMDDNLRPLPNDSLRSGAH